MTFVQKGGSSKSKRTKHYQLISIHDQGVGGSNKPEFFERHMCMRPMLTPKAALLRPDGVNAKAAAPPPIRHSFPVCPPASPSPSQQLFPRLFQRLQLPPQRRWERDALPEYIHIQIGVQNLMY